MIESDAGHLDPGADGRLRYRYCKSAVIAAWSIMASPPPPPAEVPTLIVLGAESWLTLDEHVETYRAALGDLVEVVTVPGGHTVYWDALDETSEALAAFLALARGAGGTPIRAAADGAPGTHGDDGPSRAGKDGRCPQPPGGHELS